MIMMNINRMTDYNVNLHEPLDQRDSEAIKYWLSLGRNLKIDSDYHVYLGCKWIADAKPKKNKT